MNAREEEIRIQKEYSDFLLRETAAQTKTLAKLHRDQESFIRTLREKEIELTNKERQVNDYFSSVERVKADMRSREIKLNEREAKLIELHNQLLQDEDLNNWLKSKKLTFMERSKEDIDSLKEDS